MCVAPITNAKRVAQVIFPLDEQLGLSNSVFSPAFAKQMVWLSGLLPYAQSVEVMERIGERYISSSTTWRLVEFYGERMETHVAHQREQVSVERIQLPDAQHDHDQRKGVSIDGGMVNIRADGWRELKVGTVFDVQLRLERNPHSCELEEMAHGVNVHYTAVIGTKADFTPALWALAVQHNLPTARNRSVVADGALWIWDVVEDVCPDGQQVVDWFHAVEHLNAAATTLYPSDEEVEKRKRWLKTYKDHLYMGRIDNIIAVLHKRNLSQLATYFARHKRRMQYLEFREAGLPIGSGTVESGVKQFKQRLTATGMSWHLDNAKRMIVIRSAILGHDFDDLWANIA